MYTVGGPFCTGSRPNRSTYAVSILSVLALTMRSTSDQEVR